VIVFRSVSKREVSKVFLTQSTKLKQTLRGDMEMQSHDKGGRQERLRKMLLRKREEFETRIREELKEKMNEDLNSVFGAGLDLADLVNRDLGRDVDYGLLHMYTERRQLRHLRRMRWKDQRETP
jgi:hypothetical protein